MREESYSQMEIAEVDNCDVDAPYGKKIMDLKLFILFYIF